MQILLLSLILMSINQRGIRINSIFMVMISVGSTSNGLDTIHFLNKSVVKGKFERDIEGNTAFASYYR